MRVWFVFPVFLLLAELGVGAFVPVVLSALASLFVLWRAFEKGEGTSGRDKAIAVTVSVALLVLSNLLQRLPVHCNERNECAEYSHGRRIREVSPAAATLSLASEHGILVAIFPFGAAAILYVFGSRRLEP